MSQATAHEESTTYPTQAELLKAIDDAWSKLGQTIAVLSQEQLVNVRDPAGWSTREHIVHLIAWERSLIALLQGADREQALGLRDGEFSSLDIDVMNDLINQRKAHLSLEEVFTEFRRTHDEVIGILSSLSDADLLKPYSHYQPQVEPPREAPVVGWILGNTSEHYAEHTTWIRKLNSLSPL